MDEELQERIADALESIAETLSRLLDIAEDRDE